MWRQLAAVASASSVLFLAAAWAAPNDALAATRAVTPARPWFGTLQTSGNYLGQERAAGVNAATLELAWDRYEPGSGQFNQAYVDEQRQKLGAERAAGMLVTLDVGLQYPPAWVFGLDPNTRFVNQYGDVYAGNGIGSNVPDYVFDSVLRGAVAAYIARVAADFGDAFYAIRTGGLVYGELHYPDADYHGHSNSYWVFGANAQANSPVPGWRPGRPGVAAAQQFLSYYTSALTGWQNWQISIYRRFFNGWIEVLYPSWGLRPGDIQTVTGNLLSGTTSPEINHLPQQGLDWAAQVASITDRRTIVYSTWIEAPDHGTTQQLVSPIVYLRSLALNRTPALHVAGENSGGNGYAEMQLAVSRVRQLGLAGLMWAWEPQLFSGSSPSLADYARLIGSQA